MTSPAFEAFLARIYVDAAARAQFLADPRGSAVRAGLSEAESDALVRIDRLTCGVAAAGVHLHRRFDSVLGHALSRAIRCCGCCARIGSSPRNSPRVQAADDKTPSAWFQDGQAVR